MESDGEDLENIFHEYENNENNSGVENTENKSSNETPDAIKIAPPKRIVKNPRLKFNAERLCGERGIPVIVDHFKNVKFKGPGHEKEDLDKLLSKLEHWTHRLFPSMKFEDCLTHIEKLGKKRPVQTCLRKIRLDMPILNSDFVKDNEEDDVRRNDDSEPEEVTAFDRLLEGNETTSNTYNISAPEIISDSSSYYSSPMPPVSRSYVLGSSFESSLTEEQKERMERNKMLAAEKRKARLAAMEQNNVRTQSENHENAFDAQNSFDKLLGLSLNVGNANPVSEMDVNFEENSNYENSEKLGLDDLVDLVDDDEDPNSGENGIDLLQSGQIKSVSSDINEIADSPQDDKENFMNVNTADKDNVDKIVSYSEIFPKENVNVGSSLDLVCESPVNCDVTADVDHSVKDSSLSDETTKMLNEDSTYMDCENEVSSEI